MSAETVIGIDLGTTYSVVATVDSWDKPLVLKNAEGKTTTPSVIAFESPDHVLVGEEAKAKQALGNENIASFFKRSMGDPAFFLEFFGKQYTAADLSAILLRKLKEDAETALGAPVSQAVITVPAYFNDRQRTATLQAGEKAGLNVLSIINEPTAAAIAYGANRSHADATLLVYDLGGGTFDVTLLRTGGTTLDVLATSGNHRLGGKDWDDRLLRHIVGEFRSEFGKDPRDDLLTMNELLVRCEDAKRALSALSKTTVKFFHEGDKGHYTITREMFDDMTVDLLDQTRLLCESVLADKGLSWASIDGVLLVGGSTQMKMVPEMVERVSGKPSVTGINIEEAVAVGAAIQAFIDSSYTLETKSAPAAAPGFRTVNDVTGHSLGMIVENEDRSRYINGIIIPRNTTLPCDKTRPFQFRTSPKTDLELEVYLLQGESDYPGHCDILGKYVFSDIAHEKDGQTVLDITYRYDRNGTVHVSGRQPSRDRELTLRREPVPEDMGWIDLAPKDRHGRKDARLVVTRKCYNNIGAVLRTLNLSYADYGGKTGLDCDILFLNCGTADRIDEEKLRTFVAEGGILYASDLTSSLVSAAFPRIFDFSSRGGSVGKVEALVRDEELRSIIGERVTVHFDMSAWSILDSIRRGNVILESAANGKPLMVQVPFERGEIFYTCFHNHAQANDKEMAVLKLLIMKQLGEFKQTTIAQVCEDLQTDISDYKRIFAK